MKALQTIFPKTLLLFLVLAALLSACSIDDLVPEIPDPEDDDYFLTVKIDGVDFSADITPSVSVLADQTGFYNIQGNTNDGDKLAITLVSPTSTGTVLVSGDNSETAPNIAYWVVSPYGVWAAGGTGGAGGDGVGTITITENNDTFMEGTFSFTGVNPLDNNSTKEFTEGKFKARKD